MSDFKVTFGGTDITEYVNREDVKRALAEMPELPPMAVFETWVRSLSAEELAEVNAIFEAARAEDERRMKQRGD